MSASGSARHRPWIIAVGALLLAVPVFLLAPRGETMSGLSFAPVYLRAWFWPSSYAFIAGLLGLFLFIMARMGIARGVPAGVVVYGLALGLVAFSISAVNRIPDERVAWIEPDPAVAGNLIRLDRRLQTRAAREGRPIFYYFRADWCSICPDFERLILTRVAADTAPFLAVKMDVTDFDRWHGYLEAEYGVVATPTVVLRDRSGRILRGVDFTGEHISVRALQAALRALGEFSD